MSEPVAYERPSALRRGTAPLVDAIREMPDAGAAETAAEGAAEGVAEVAAEGAAQGVAEWLAGRSVLVTGATGFLGQLLVEKMLRACPDVASIFLLVRDKRGETPERRLDRMMEDPLFERVRCRRDKLVIVTGDLAKPHLGLSEEHRTLLLSNVSLVLHCAATLRFDAPLRESTAINVRATKEMLLLARQMTHLQAFVHMSTAYAFCPNQHIEERVYQPRMSSEQLFNILDALDDKSLERIEPVLIEPWPNTYCFTKAIAEDMLVHESKGLPVCIFRPSMVIGTDKEPIPGWVNNINGPVGIVVGTALGILRTLYMKDLNYVSDLIPGDIVINGALAAAWRTANNSKGSLPPVIGGEGEDVPVYNSVSSPRNPISWKMFLNYNMKHGFEYPSEQCLWYYCLFMSNSRIVHNVQRVFLHLLPALIVDTFLRCAGRKPMLWKAYKKIHKFIDLTVYFACREWVFSDSNMQWLCSELSEKDKKIFPCNMADINWEETIKHVIPGIRMYIAKDPLNTLEKSKVRYRRLKVLHYTLVGALCLLFLQLLRWAVSLLW